MHTCVVMMVVVLWMHEHVEIRETGFLLISLRRIQGLNSNLPSESLFPLSHLPPQLPSKLNINSY